MLIFNEIKNICIFLKKSCKKIWWNEKKVVSLQYKRKTKLNHKNKTIMRTEIWNKMGTLSKRIANNGGKGVLFTATHDTCNGEKWMWIIQFDCSCGTKEGGYQSETEQDALNKGIEFCKEKGYEFI